MPTAQDDTIMDFGPNLFCGEDGSASAPSTGDANSSNDALEGAAVVSDQKTEGDLERSKGEAAGGQVGGSDASPSTDGTPGLNPGQPATQASAGKSELGTKALSSAKAAVKVFDSINGFDEQSANQRTVVRDLMVKQSEAMELKLQGKKPLEGEDFDAIAKQLRRENNRLDSLLEGKESLFGKARKAVDIAIEHMQGVIAEINRLEEEG